MRSVASGPARLEAFGEVFGATAVDPPTSRIFSMEWKEGSDAVLARLGDDGAFVTDDFANDHQLRIGSTVEETFPNGETAPFKVEGIFDPPTGGSPFGPVTISAKSWDRYNGQPQNLYSFVIMKGGQTDTNRAALDRTLEEFPNAKVQTRDEFVDNQISGLSSVLNILYVLLGLSVLVSFFGIVNTFVLTVFERTREIGMLRAVGMTRRQVRRMIRAESVITAAIGGVLGILLGIALGALLVARVDFIDFTLPVVQLIVFAVAALIVGVLAAIFPARRAARLNVLAVAPVRVTTREPASSQSRIELRTSAGRVPAIASDARKRSPRMRPRSSTKRKREARVGEPEPLKRRLGQDERLGLLEGYDIRRSRKPVEESDLAEEVARARARELAADPSSLRHEHLERAARDDEEAAVELATGGRRTHRRRTRAPACTGVRRLDRPRAGRRETPDARCSPFDGGHPARAAAPCSITP